MGGCPVVAGGRTMVTVATGLCDRQAPRRSACLLGTAPRLRPPLPLHPWPSRGRPSRTSRSGCRSPAMHPCLPVRISMGGGASTCQRTAQAVPPLHLRSMPSATVNSRTVLLLYFGRRRTEVARPPVGQRWPLLLPSPSRTPSGGPMLLPRPRRDFGAPRIAAVANCTPCYSNRVTY